MKNAKKLINFINNAVDFTDKTGIVIDFAFTSNWRLKSFRGKQGIYIIREHGIDEIYLALTYLGKTKEIEGYCKDESLSLIGKIPFDPAALKAVNDGKTIVEQDCFAGRALKEIFQEILKKM